MSVYTSLTTEELDTYWKVDTIISKIIDSFDNKKDLSLNIPLNYNNTRSLALYTMLKDSIIKQTGSKPNKELMEFILTNSNFQQ